MKAKKIKIDAIILATTICTVFYSATYPFIYKQIMEVIPSDLYALNQIISCLGISVFGVIWNKWSNKLFKFYLLFLISDGVINIAVTVWTLITGDIIAYYLLNAIITATVTRNLICAGNRLRIVRYQGNEDRERYQNNNNTASAVSTIIGSIIAMQLDLSFEIMFVLGCIGYTIDTVFYVYIYLSTMKNYKSENK